MSVVELKGNAFNGGFDSAQPTFLVGFYDIWKEYSAALPHLTIIQFQTKFCTKCFLNRNQLWFESPNQYLHSKKQSDLTTNNYQLSTEFPNQNRHSKKQSNLTTINYQPTTNNYQLTTEGWRQKKMNKNPNWERAPQSKLLFQNAINPDNR